MCGAVGSESEGEPADDAAEGEQDDDSEHEQMEHWLDEFEDMEDKHKQKLERGTRRGGGHKGAVEVSVCSRCRCVVSADEAELRTKRRTTSTS